MELVSVENENGIEPKGHVLIEKELYAKDPLNWLSMAESIKGSHLEEVKGMVREYRKPVVQLGGETLNIAQVAAVAQNTGVVVEMLESAKGAVEANRQWILENMKKGTDMYGITTGFGANSYRRTKQGGELQDELIR